jgi:large subunit ribosomal protein L19
MANIATWVPHEDGKKTVDFHVGDTVRVHYKLIEKEKTAGKAKREVHETIRERLQAFEGIVIAIKNRGENVMFTVRRVGAGAIGVERIFPLNSPWIKKLEVKRKGDVRRAKLYYLRDKVGKAAQRVDELRSSSANSSPEAATSHVSS